jgi:hypothetical protein
LSDLLGGLCRFQTRANLRIAKTPVKVKDFESHEVGDGCKELPKSLDMETWMKISKKLAAEKKGVLQGHENIWRKL